LLRWSITASRRKGLHLDRKRCFRSAPSA
jgi:hypothetical protein